MDDDILREAVRKHQNNWVFIRREYFPLFTNDQIRKHAQRIGITWTKTRTMWSREELRLLQTEIAKGVSTKEIHARHLPHRSLAAIRKQVVEHDFVIDFDHYRPDEVLGDGNGKTEGGG